MALGAALLVFFNTPLGAGINNHVIKFVFALPGIILAQITVISALAIRLLKSTFDSIDPRYEQVARTLGCSKPEAFFRVTLPLARDGLIASGILTWARALGEFGATVTLAGATAMKTETLPTAIFLSLASADVEKAIAVIFVLIVIAVVALLVYQENHRQKVPDMIEIKNLSLHLGEFYLKDINLSIGDGEYFVILGPTGAGKTVLMECIAGLHRIKKGEIWFDRTDVTQLVPEERNVGYVPQDYVIFPFLNVFDNIAFGLKQAKICRV